MRCFNRNVLLGLAAVAAVVLVAAPSAFGAILPLLVVAACPLSMVLMMRGMSGNRDRCATGTDTADAARTGSAAADSGELAKLRAEVDQLTAELADRHPRADQR